MLIFNLFLSFRIDTAYCIVIEKENNYHISISFPERQKNITQATIKKQENGN
jgi:hypothetical protein